MKEQEEREQNGEVIHNSDGSPLKPGEEGDLLERADEPDSTAPEESTAKAANEATESPSDGREPQTSEMAQGALGQVKAKVEVCKDESIGKEDILVIVISLLFLFIDVHPFIVCIAD